MATQELAVHPGGAVVQPRHFDMERLRVLKEVIAPGTTDVELAFFGEACQRTGLDPFAKQIYCIKRSGKLTIQTGIDGYRSIAERSGLYAGQTPPQWCGPDGVWKEVWLDRQHPPAAARVGILRKDFDAPVWGVAHYSEYVQVGDGGRPIGQWGRMPANQLCKCSEALGLRKAFPQQLGGIYTAEEMEQAENTDADLRASRLAAAKAATPPPPELSPLDAAVKEFRSGDKFARLKTFRELKARIVAIAGDDVSYYRILGKHNVEHSDQFKSMTPAVACFKELWQYVQDIKRAEREAQERGDVIDPPFDAEEPADA